MSGTAAVTVVRLDLHWHCAAPSVGPPACGIYRPNVSQWFVTSSAQDAEPSRDILLCPCTPALPLIVSPPRGGGRGAPRVYMSTRASLRQGVWPCGLLTSCRASSWVSAAAGKILGVLDWFWIYKLTGHVHCIRWRPFRTSLLCMLAPLTLPRWACPCC